MNSHPYLRTYMAGVLLPVVAAGGPGGSRGFTDRF